MRKDSARGAGTALASLALALLASVPGCSVESREEEGPHAVFADLRGLTSFEAANDTGAANVEPFAWPAAGPRSGTIEVAGFGTIRVALFPELAPKTVANFETLANQGFYDGTTFHRVIPGFMIQGGDPNTRDDDPTNDGQGGPGYTIEDEFSRAPLEAGVVAMANRGTPHSGGAQFFIVHENSPHLLGKYTVFGRLVDGFAVVHEIAQVETDATGRWGPENRPLQNVVIARVRVE